MRETNLYRGPTLECWSCETPAVDALSDGVWIDWDCGYCGQVNEVEEAEVTG